MLTPETIRAFNSTVIPNSNVKTMTVEQGDALIRQGKEAEELLNNNLLFVSIQTTKIEIMDELATITGHTEEHNNKRIALANQVAGLERFVDSLRHAVGLKNRVVTARNGSDPAQSTLN